MSERSYTVIVYRAEEGGYWTDVPALPCTGSHGDTLEEAIEMTKEAIALMLETLIEEGKPVPEDVEPVETVCKVTVTA